MHKLLITLILVLLMGIPADAATVLSQKGPILDTLINFDFDTGDDWVVLDTQGRGQCAVTIDLGSFAGTNIGFDIESSPTNLTAGPGQAWYNWGRRPINGAATEDFITEPTVQAVMTGAGTYAEWGPLANAQYMRVKWTRNTVTTATGQIVISCFGKKAF